MDSNELKALLGDLKRLDYPPPAAPDASFASSSRYSARDAEAEAQSILKRLKPVYGHVTGATSKVEGRMEAREADEQLPKDEDAVLKLLWSRPAFRDVVASVRLRFSLCSASSDPLADEG